MLHWVWPHCEFIQTKFYIFFTDLSNIIENVITLKSSLLKLLAQEVREEGLAEPQGIPTSLWVEPPVAWSAISLGSSFRTDVPHQLGKCPDSRGERPERETAPWVIIGSFSSDPVLVHMPNIPVCMCLNPPTANPSGWSCFETLWSFQKVEASWRKSITLPQLGPCPPHSYERWWGIPAAGSCHQSLGHDGLMGWPSCTPQIMSQI